MARTEERMAKVIEALSQELRGIRTGRASVAMVEGVRVDCYGSKMPLNQVSNISVPQPRLIEIKVWDATAVAAVEKAIISSNIGLMPNTEGQTIRLNVPTLTSERREEIVKHLYLVTEDFRIEIRSIRRDANEEVKKLQKDSDISEDESFRAQEKIQKLTDKSIEKINSILALKEKEIREE
ncbi:MAG: ribosome recycling factor [Elusimicrobia bacterium]|nr:ribosome recycling factor [Elusimicrobiota bacterium]